MNDQTKPALYAPTPEAHATIAAALRLYQHELGQTGSTAHAARFQDIATNNGTVTPLTSAQIDTLCMDLNHDGLEFSAIVPLFAESAKDSPYVAAAQSNAREGEIEVDEPAVVSRGDDDGAYVMGWVWVSNDAAGLSTYWTIQLVGTIPDGARPSNGEIVPPEPIWYFGDEDEQTKAIEYATQLGLRYEAGTVNNLPEDEEFINDFDEFKEHADWCANERDPV